MKTEAPENSSAMASQRDLTTRDRILSAALDEFTEFGQAGARVDRIARAAGVNKAMIYYHFSSKEKLFLETVRSFFDNVAQRARETVQPTASLREALFALATLHAETLQRNPRLAPLMMRELARPQNEMVEQIAHAFGASGIPQRVMAYLDEGVKAGHFRPIDNRHLLASFVSLSLGYFFIAPVIDLVLEIEDRDRFVQERCRVIVEIFLSGIEVK